MEKDKEKRKGDVQMNKNAIKKYAVWARRELISRVSQRAAFYEITEDGFGNPAVDSVRGMILTAAEKRQRRGLIAQIRQKGYQEVMEEVAYTWFNRFSALRFMEVNGYLPTHVRVFTDDNNAFRPQILTEAIHMEFDELDMEKVYALKNGNKDEELFKYMIIAQCNALNGILPGMFQKIEDYTELLFPDNLLREGSVAEQMIALIPEEDWKDQVQIIGWLYQYYNSEKKDEVFAALKKNVKITKENIPAATQLFTPDWIVRYMVENSLGRLWVEGHPNDELKAKWKYYLEEAEQEPEVQTQLEEIRKEYAKLNPEDIRCIDPCMGSGHILCYMFDVLVQIYQAHGVQTRDAVRSIVESNLYGLDIDDRAAQLAYFSVMMKGRQYDSRFFKRGVQPNVYSPKGYEEGKEFGALLMVDELEEMPKEAEKYGLFDESYEEQMNRWQFRKVLVQKYDVVCTNPPYMGAGNMNRKLSEFIKANFADYKSDFFSVFVVRCMQLTKTTGYLGFFTPYVWMFIQSYEKLRCVICNQKTIETLIQFEYSAFEEATVPVCTFVFKNSHVNKKGCYFRLTDFRGGMEIQRQKTLEAISNHNCGYYYETSADNFSKIPGLPVAYWLSNDIFRVFNESVLSIKDFAFGEGKNVTTNNAKYILYIWEVNSNNIGAFDYKWLPCAMGGDYRKWYGNIVHVIDWSPETRKFYKKNQAGRIIREEFWNMSGVTWGKIGSAFPSFRILENEQMYQETAVLQKEYEDTMFVLSILNTKVSQYFLTFLAPTLNFQLQDICTIPLHFKLKNIKEEVIKIGMKCVDKSKKDWDSFEYSWNFKKHPLI